MGNKKRKFNSFEELGKAHGISQNSKDSIEESVRVRVIRYDSKKGFGFLKSSKYPDKIFFHKSKLQESGYSEKLINEQTIFDAIVVETEKGLQAIKLKYVKFRVPYDTNNLLENEKPENFNLAYHKFATFYGKKFDFPNNIVTTANWIFSKIPFKNLKNNYVKSLKKLPLLIQVLTPLKPDWRLIVGLGSDSVYETGITLHHIYGFPYIPGQAVKGTLRSFIINEFFDKKEGNEKGGALCDPLFCDIFGCPRKSFYGEARAGLIWFFDAFPTSPPKLELDVMTPHYKDYYSGKGNLPPADYFNPVTIQFLTIGMDTEFQFVLGISKTKGNITIKNYENSQLLKGVLEHGLKLNPDSSLLNVTSILLQKALTEQGIGAKTAVGYGYFKEK